MRYLTWFWHHSRGVRCNMAVRIVTGLLQVVLGLLVVWLSKRFIDETIRTGDTADVTAMVAWLVLTVVAGIMLRQLYFYMTTLATVRLTNRLRLAVFNRLFTRNLYTGQEMHSGDVSSRLAKDIETVSEVTTATMPQMVVTMLQLTGAFLLMRWFDARLAWILLLMTPLAVVFVKAVARQLRQMTLAIRRDESRIQMHVQEGMEHNAVLRSMQSEQWVTDQLDTMQQQLRGNVVRRTRFTVVTRFVMGCAFGLGYMLAFVWGALGLRDGTITFGVMTSFLQLVSMIQNPVLQLLNMVPQVIHATASVDRLEELRTPAASSRVPTRSVQTDDGFELSPCLGLRVSDVSFSYADGDRLLLSHFSHDFRPGSKTAIMGETGIGKTTLFRLLLGFIQPVSGTIKMYGEGGDRETAPYVGAICFVPQGNTLMSGSIRYNLQLAHPEATDDELWHVLHTACADFVGDLPAGLDTELGERGSGLSEGQAQRIAIARGLLRPGSIMLLDEISASLDEPTEQELYRRLFAAYPQKTMLFITHRSAVAHLCDDVLKF